MTELLKSLNNLAVLRNIAQHHTLETLTDILEKFGAIVSEQREETNIGRSAGQ